MASKNSDVPEVAEGTYRRTYQRTYRRFVTDVMEDLSTFVREDHKRHGVSTRDEHVIKTKYKRCDKRGMEFVSTRVSTRRNRKWKKKRHWRKRARDQVKVEVEVKSSKCQKIAPGNANVLGARPTSITNIMQADAFWKNYTAAQEWQTRHNVTWWRSRCMALEYENKILRDKIRSLFGQFHCPGTVTDKTNYHKENIKENAYDEDAEEFEFTVTEEMLNFFEKSERHKREMKQKYKSDKVTYKEESAEDNLIAGSAVSARARKEEANELYGEASPKILAMEAALQATLDNYKDKVKSQFWPNIPLKP